MELHSVGLASAVAAHPATAVALVDGDTSITYGELSDRVARTAGGLRALGCGPQSRVAVAARVETDGIVAYLGVLASGASAAMINPRAPAPELTDRLEAVGAELVVLGCEAIDLPDGWRAARPAGSRHGGWPVLGGEPLTPSDLDPSAPAVILLTSGVAGSPRAAVLTHGNLTAVQRGLVEQPGSTLGPDTVGLACLPLAHVYGLNSVLGTWLRCGARVVLLDGFDPAAMLELVVRHGVNSLAAVPQMWGALAAVDGPDDALAGVHRATSSAAHLRTEVAAAVEARFGVRIASGYGLTETAGTVVSNDIANPGRFGVGTPLGDTVIRVVDNDGAPCEAGDVGSVWIAGSSVFAGYAGPDPTGTSMLAPGGWCRTGDIGVLDEQGGLTLVDRAKDVINIGGFNVSPAEVEAVLTRHPDVLDAAVLGTPDARAGERAVAFVVGRATPQRADEDELISFCREHLARYKVPIRIEWRDQLPTTEGGKVIRRLVR